MITVKKFLQSSVGQKYCMAVTGLALTAFVIVHFLGNLTLYFPDNSVFNSYAGFLVNLGEVIEVLEIGLLLIFVLHLFLAIVLKINHRRARPQGYEHSLKTKGGDNRNTVSSRFMIVTGILLFGFLILHVKQFHFGPNIEDGYRATVSGKEVRDLYRLVSEIFHNPLFVGVYLLSMIALGLHLRHGIWSAFQSLGVLNARLTGPFYKLALILSILIALGFFFIPLWFYFDIPQKFLR